MAFLDSDLPYKTLPDHAGFTNGIILHPPALRRDQSKLFFDFFSGFFRLVFPDVLHVDPRTVFPDFYGDQMDVRMSCIIMPIHQIRLLPEAYLFHIGSGYAQELFGGIILRGMKVQGDVHAVSFYIAVQRILMQQPAEFHSLIQAFDRSRIIAFPDALRSTFFHLVFIVSENTPHRMSGIYDCNHFRVISHVIS